MQNRKPVQLPRQAGFTLMEMVIVVALIGLVASLVGTNVIRKFSEAKVDSTKIQMKQIMVILQDFKRTCGNYPGTDQGLDALVHPPQDCKNADPSGFVKKMPTDSWSTPFAYELRDSEKFVITSYGADKKPGGDGFNKDITSEELE